MRKPLQPARDGETLAAVLSRIGPASMGRSLADGPGFRIATADGDATIERTDRPGRFTVAGTGLTAEVRLDCSAAHGVAVQSVTLTNTGDAPSPAIREVEAFCLPLAVTASDEPWACGFGGGVTDGFYPPRAYRPEPVCFGKARDWVPRTLGWHRWWTGKAVYALRSSPEGRSSNPNLPVMFAGWQAGADGVGLWAAMEWSGRWRLEMGNREDWRFVFRGGPTVQDMVLEPGESVRLPRAHVGAFAGGRAEATNSVRRYIAEVLAPDVGGRRPQPFVAYDHWFGIHERISEELLCRQADRAAELGCEYFVIDAGWYGSATKFFADGVGNWERIDEDKFPRGLEAVSDHVRGKGMGFGLWFEPERARRGSDWAMQHADWYWDLGRGPNLHLNLTRRDAQDGLIAMLSAWIGRLDIRWLRWDNNHAPGPFFDAVDPTGKVQFAHFEGLYRVLDTLLERHPDLMIDNCAGGGQRVDFGTLRRAGTMVISDHAEDPHVCRAMQTGGARVLPGNYMNSSLYVAEDDPERAVGPLELLSRMAGSITLNGHIANWPAEQARMVRRHLDGFRTYRHLLMKDFHALTPYPRGPADWDAVEFVDPDAGEAVVLAYRVRGGRQTLTVHPVGLRARASYEVRDPFSERRPHVESGSLLMKRGVRLGLEEEGALALHFVPKS